MEGGEKKIKVAHNVFFALVAILSAKACEKIGLRDGDPGTVVNQTTCWKDPGGKNASRLEAPTGQEDHGLIREGAKAIITADEETKMFGATSGMGTSIRVVINGEDITPSLGVIDFMAQEQRITAVPIEPKNQVCWIKSTDFAPANK
ncbi:MAG: hypothetical protein NTV24_01825 [Candidatus Woesebacteria bacterium]|nr:hypothetical protein [Candidatus Woesebacteria bacterium]